MMNLLVLILGGQPYEPLAKVTFDKPKPEYRALRKKIESLGRDELIRFKAEARNALERDSTNSLKGYAYYYADLIGGKRYGFGQPFSEKPFYRITPSRDPEFIRLRVLRGITIPEPNTNSTAQPQAVITDRALGYDRMILRESNDQLLLANAAITYAWFVKGGTKKGLDYARRAVAAKGVTPHWALFSLAFLTAAHGLNTPNGGAEQKALFKESRVLIARYKASNPPPFRSAFLLDSCLKYMAKRERLRSRGRL